MLKRKFAKLATMPTSRVGSLGKSQWQLSTHSCHKSRNHCLDRARPARTPYGKTDSRRRFLIPLDGKRYGIGQLAGDWKGELYVVIYDKLVARSASPDDVDGAGLQFAALTLDAKFHHGDWPIIGNRQDNLPDLPQPWFKVGVGGETHIEARDRSVTRRATSTEEAGLRNRTVVAPVRIENALKALHGLAEWNPRFDDLHAAYALQSAKLVGG
jgi:hypothetical protein